MREQRFEFSGGDLGLDFANTVGGTRSSPTEHLGAYADLLAWAREADIIDAPQEKRLRREAEKHPQEAARAFRRATELREAIFRIFDQRAKGRGVPADDLAILDREAREANAHRALKRRSDGGVEYSWSSEEQLDAPTWRVAQAATDLLLSDVGVVKECASDTCDWLFVDRSRNRTRRWCDMRECGNRAKVRRYHARLRSGRRS